MVLCRRNTILPTSLREFNINSNGALPVFKDGIIELSLQCVTRTENWLLAI